MKKLVLFFDILLFYKHFLIKNLHSGSFIIYKFDTIYILIMKNSAEISLSN